MRLSETYYIVKNALDHWIEPNFQELKQRGGMPSLYGCAEMIDIFKLLEPIRFLPDVDECLYIIESISPSLAERKTLYMDSDARNKIVSSLNMLNIKLEAMRSMCETLGIERDSDGFDIKLPPNIELADAAQCMEDLDILFSKCHIFPDDTQIKFSGVDIGSVWMTFVVIGAGAVATIRIIAELVDKAIAIRSHALAYKQEEEKFRTLKLENDVLEHVIHAHSVALKKITEDIVEELSEYNGVTEHEDQERIRMSVERLEKWIGRGMEIHASINAPKETKLLFPPIERQSLPQEIIKALADTGKDE